MTLTNDEVEFLRREARIDGNGFSCADMLRVLDALDDAVRERAEALRNMNDSILFAREILDKVKDRAEKAEVSGEVHARKIGRIQIALDGHEMETDPACDEERRVRALIDEVKALRAKVDEYRAAAAYCLSVSGEERDDAVRDMDLIR